MLSTATANAVFAYALRGGADFAELFLEDRDDVSIDCADRVNEVSRMRSYGAGLYLLKGNSGAYVYLNDLSEPALRRAADDALALMGASGEGGGTPRPFTVLNRENPCPVLVSPSEAGQERKISLLREAVLCASSLPEVSRCRATWFDRDQRVTILNSKGVHAEDRRVTTRMRFIPVVSRNGETASSFTEYCAAAGMEAFESGRHLEQLTTCCKRLRGSIGAPEAPSCRVPVVLEAGACSGTFFHEACGHQLETRSLQEGGLFWDRRGQQIASPQVTLIDDGTLKGMYGSARFDDEGMARQRNVLIENGMLKGFMADRLGARRLGLARTGSGRRQDYAHAPGPRMSNTFLAAGMDDDDAMIRDLDEGLYVTEIGGGTGGREFTLLAACAYWVKNGQIGPQVKGAILVGRGDETMLKIDRVGRTFVAEQGGGSFCGADSGFIPTTTSGPRMRIAEMVVGGKGENL